MDNAIFQMMMISVRQLKKAYQNQINVLTSMIEALDRIEAYSNVASKIGVNANQSQKMIDGFRDFDLLTPTYVMSNVEHATALKTYDELRSIVRKEIERGTNENI